MELIKYKSKLFYKECGHFDRTNKRIRFTKNIEEKKQKDRIDLETDLADLKYSNWFRWWTQMYIVHPLKWFSKKIHVYHKTKVTRLKFDAFIKRRKTLNKVINEKLVKKEKKVNVYIGDATQPGNCGIKGYIRYPGKEFGKALENHPKVNVIKINERMTTKKCASCLETTLDVSKSPHRYTFCSKCHILWNRDINAALNILKLGFHKMRILQSHIGSLLPLHPGKL